MLSEEIKYKIIFLLENRMSFRKIAREVNKPYSTVYGFINKYQSTKKLKRKFGSGRPKIMTSEDIDTLEGIIKNNTNSSVPMINHIFYEKTKKKLQINVLEII